MQSFNSNELISDPELLFGRQKSLEILVKTIKSGTNRQIQGEKRFGKTCFLHCTKSILDKEQGFITLYFDCKKLDRFKGTVNFYRRLIASIIVEVSKKRLLDREHIIKNFKIFPSLDIDEIYETLLEVKDFIIESIFEEIIPYYSELFDVRFVFLLDEYEHLMKTILDNPQGFMLIRTLSDLPKSKGIKPLTYILSGSWSWIKMCTLTGSPELNNQGASILYLGAIDFEAFNSMINFYSNDKKFSLKTKVLYDYSGGITFYAKKIAVTIQLGGVDQLNYTLLNDDFVSIFKNLEQNEKQLLQNILNKKGVNRSLAGTLVARGILKENGANFSINGDFFQEYIAHNLKEENQASEILEKLVETIFEKIEKINLNYRNNQSGNRNYLFEPIINEHTMRNEFRKVCNDSSDFQVFVNSVYRCVFERTAENGKNLQRIPKHLQAHAFKKHIDSFRQIYIHQSTSIEFRPSRNQFNSQDLYNFYLGRANEPTDRQFYIIQKKILDNFESYLDEIGKVIGK